MSRNALNLNFNKLQYEDFTSCIFTFIYLFFFSLYVLYCTCTCSIPDCEQRMILLLSYYKSSSVCLFVCLSVCSLSPPRSFDRSSPNLVGVCRWTSELPLRGSFSKRSTARRVNGSLSLSTILYMHQPHATRCNGSSCLQLQSLIRHLLLDGYRTASQQCI